MCRYRIKRHVLIDTKDEYLYTPKCCIDGHTTHIWCNGTNGASCGFVAVEGNSRQIKIDIVVHTYWERHIYILEIRIELQIQIILHERWRWKL